MSLTKQQALDLFRSDDLIGIGMEANSVRRRLHPEGVATYIIDRNINYTNYLHRVLHLLRVLSSVERTEGERGIHP
jgi:hypothetical protein